MQRLTTAWAALQIVALLAGIATGLAAQQQSPPAAAPLAPPLAAHAGRVEMTPARLLALVGAAPAGRFLDLYSIRWMRDGRHIIYTTHPNITDSSAHIEQVDIQTSAWTQLGIGTAPLPSPDGRHIAFVRDSGAAPQLWVMAADGTGARMLSHVAGGLQGVPLLARVAYAWAPAGRRLALGYRPSWTPIAYQTRPESAGTTAIEADTPRARATNGSVVVFDVRTGSSTSVASVVGTVNALSWFPDGNELLITTLQLPVEYGDSAGRGTVSAVRLSDGRVRTIFTSPGAQQQLHPALSPDGRRVVFAYNNPYQFTYDFLTALAVVDAGDSATHVVPLTHDVRMSGAAWSADGRHLYAARTYGAYDQMYRIDVATGALTQLTRGPRAIRSFTLSGDRTKLAWIAEDAQDRTFIQVANADGSDVRTIRTMTAPPDSVSLSEVREVKWTSTGGVRIRGLVVMPLRYRQGMRYPLIVDIHGGGWGSRIGMEGSLVGSSLEWHMWAAKGYAVLVPDYRASGLYGWQAVLDMREHQDMAERDADDILSGVDYLIATGLVDSSRTAVVGFSAGAYRANWLAVRSHRFRAIVSQDGWADEYLQDGLHPIASLDWLYRGTPSEVPLHYLEQSPIFYANEATTPTLFLMGSQYRGSIDLTGSVQFLYTALKRQGVDTRFVMYPDEGHGIRRIENRRDLVRRAIAWIDGHMGKASPPDSAR